ncbi:type III pantothenate kinase [Chitinilyticum litopenaei]|uniref:type III pantothenate kinase n=1 Tax=Chitinilyticum litopenaei TaxID=1121276 RepID=UPI0003F5E9B0|nr:type III pantothenate kinase [Chitinilyticum litopenaei]
MELLIDLGNTRTKWLLSSGALPADSPDDAAAHPPVCLPAGHASDAASLFAAWRDLPRPHAVAGCAVGSAQLQQKIAAFCRTHWQLQAVWLHPSAQDLGIANPYASGQLGSDRWAALLGAATLHPHTGLVVVSAGTACVIDALSRHGQFLGGYIAPGYRMQRLALHQHTARLPLAEGGAQAFPHNTADAIASGCLFSLTGAITQMAEQLAQHDGCPPHILLSGGDAALLASRLNKPARVVDNLPLRGLAALRTSGEGVFLP